MEQLFPVLAKPRYYRWMMFNKLSDFLKTYDEKYLKYYSWWFKKWKKEYPQEYSTPTDRGEGTAEYTSLRSISLNTKSCSIEKGKVYKDFKKYRKAWFKKEEFDLSSESYSVGSLSGFVLDIVSKGWKLNVSGKNLSPIELLASKFNPVEPESKNLEDLKEFEKLANKEMAEIDESGDLMTGLSQLKSSDYYKLFIPSKTWNMGGFSASGMYQILQPTSTIKSMQVIGLSSPVKYKKKTQVVDIKSKDHKLMRVRNAPCPNGEIGSVFLINKAEVKPSGILKAKLGDIDYDLKVKKSKKKSWLCG